MNRRTFLRHLFTGAAALAVAPALLRSAKPAGDAPYDPEVLRNTPYVGTTNERLWRENPEWKNATHEVWLNADSQGDFGCYRYRVIRAYRPVRPYVALPVVYRRFDE